LRFCSVFTALGLVAGAHGLLAQGRSGDTPKEAVDASRPDVKPDPNALVDARAALGEHNLQSLRYTASGTMVMNASSDSAATPAPVKSYEVQIDYPASTMQIDIVAGADDVAAAGAPAAHHVETISGALAWDADFQIVPAVDGSHKKARGNDRAHSGVASAEPPRLNGAASLLRRQAIWMTPHGFLKAALSNQPALRAAGSGTEVSFYAGTNRYVGFLNSKHQVERVRTWVRRPDQADVLIDTTYTDYAAFGNIAFPTRIRQLQNGRPVLDVTVSAVEANAPVHVIVPKSIALTTVAP
jgi:hypothetical protein